MTEFQWSVICCAFGCCFCLGLSFGAWFWWHLIKGR